MAAFLSRAAEFARLIFGRRERYLATNEYWVYLPGAAMPDQTEIMARVVGNNPYIQKGRNPITPREGLLFSDIRLHIALLLRSKNPHIFRPDLFDEHIEPTAEILESLANSESLVKVRFISEDRLRNRACVQLLPHIADAIADQGGGEVIYDCIKEELLSRDRLQQILAANMDLTTAELQVRTIWRREDQGGRAETRGLRKIGLPELATGRMEADEQVLVTEILAGAAKALWDGDKLAEQLEVGLFEDVFHVMISPPKDFVSSVRIMRVQAV